MGLFSPKPKPDPDDLKKPKVHLHNWSDFPYCSKCGHQPTDEEEEGSTCTSHTYETVCMTCPKTKSVRPP